MAIDISIIIVNYRTYELTRDAVYAVHKVMKSGNYEYEVIIVDNFSEDGSYEKLKMLNDDSTHIIQTSKNGGFGYGNNIGVEESSGKYLFFLNSDTILYPDVLLEMIEYMEHNEEVGMLSCLMEDENNIPLVSGHPFENARTLFLQTIVKPLVPIWIQKKRGQRFHYGMSNKVIECDWVCGAAMLTPRKVFDEVGGWSKAFFMYMEDEELCQRIHKAGHSVQVYPKLGLKHMVGKSGGSDFVAYEKYKSVKTYFKITTGKDRWYINLLIYIQAWQYMSKLDRVTKKSVISKLRRYTYE